MKKICLLTSYNQYESKREFTFGLSHALKKKGVETLILDLEEVEVQENFFNLIQDFSPDLITSFNSFLPTPSGKYLWDILYLPTLFIIVDPCVYYSNLEPSPYLWLSSVDRSDTVILEQNGYENTFFMPHAVDLEIDHKEEKALDVLLTGSCYDYESLREYWRAHLPADQQAVLEGAIEEVLGPGCISLFQALLNGVVREKMDKAQADLYQLFYYLDYYTRGVDRVNLVRSFKNTAVHVFGELGNDHPSAKKGWEYYLKGMPNVHLHSHLRYDAALKMQQRAKFCLNSMPFFKNGSHERILTALMSEAVPVTSESLWTQEEFEEGKELFIYKPGRYEGIEDRVQALLKDEPLRRSMVEKGKAKVIARHTWDNRAELILNKLASQ